LERSKSRKWFWGFRVAGATPSMQGLLDKKTVMGTSPFCFFSIIAPVSEKGKRLRPGFVNKL
jgi:hypothetical protein